MRFSALPQLTDELVSIRPIEERDLAAWASIVWLPEVQDCTSWSLSATEDLTPYVWRPSEHSASSPLRFAIVDRQSSQLVGTIGFHGVDPTTNTAEMAYELHPTFWGRGVATRLCHALTKWGHDMAGLLEIRATTLVSNTRSIRVLESCAYHRDGTLVRYRAVRGVPSDYYLYSHKPTSARP